jgi:aspartate/methionine/tyrosine aminotransferase
MDFQNFELEYFQSLYERTVDYNLADSSVQCPHVRDLLDSGDASSLVNLPLFYPEVNGTALLRERIASQYRHASPGNVLVTVGASQANNLVANALLGRGDEVIVISPGYRQIWGLARNLGCAVSEVQLRPENDWGLDLDELEKMAGRGKTKLIAVVNPNNPTGSILSAEEMRHIVATAERSGAWLHADEVYCGTEREGPETPTFWGMYDKVICVNSLSKAYGLGGLRIGWVLAAPDVIEHLWRRHEYTVIAASAPSMELAEMALEPAKRATLLERQRSLSREGHKILAGWVAEQNGRFSWKTPPSTSVAFVRSHLDMASVDLANHVRKKASVLVAPGAYLGTENHLRIAVGYDAERLRAALGRIAEVTEALAPENMSALRH